MLIELKLSMDLLKFSKIRFEAIEKLLLDTYGKISISDVALDAIVKNLAFDKKNVMGRINFVLLHDFGNPQIDYQVPNSKIIQAFEYYKKA